MFIKVLIRGLLSLFKVSALKITQTGIMQDECGSQNLGQKYSIKVNKPNNYGMHWTAPYGPIMV